MSNIKVVKVDSIKLGGAKKTKKNTPNIDYLKNIVRDTKTKFKPKENIDLANTDMITNLLSKKQSKKNIEVRKAPESTKPPKQEVAKPPKQEVAKPLKQEVAKPPKQEVAKPPKQEVAKPPKQEVVKSRRERKANRKRLQVPKAGQLPKKVGKKTSKREIISFFSKEDQKKMRTKRDKKLISSNLVAPKVEKKTKKNLYKIAVRNILKKDEKNRSEIEKMSRNQFLEELSKNGIIEKDSKAPNKILKDLYHLYLLTEVNVSK